jgi:hypothetical protein
MLTSLGIIASILAFVWSCKVLGRSWTTNEPTALAALTAPLSIVCFIALTCWEIVLGVGGFLFCIWIVGRCFSGISCGSGGGGGKIIKGGLVGVAMVLALPPFWPITIPLLAILGVAWLCMAPISMLFGSVKEFMGD